MIWSTISSADWLIKWSGWSVTDLIKFFFEKKNIFWMILSTDLINRIWWADLLIWSGKVLSIDLSNKYLTGPSQISVLWSFRYVMPKYCQLIFLINTWLAWPKILSADLSDKVMIADKTWLATNTLFVTDSLLATYFIEEAEVLSDFSSC